MALISYRKCSSFPTFFSALGRTKHAAELSTYKEDVARLELRLSEERRERKVLEEQVGLLLLGT